MPLPYNYEEKAISEDTRSLLNFYGKGWVILFNEEQETISFADELYVKNLVYLMNVAYNRGLEDKT